MNGKHHLAAGAAMAAGGIAIGAAALGAVPDTMKQQFFGWSSGQVPQIAAGCLFYTIGVLLPDCDQSGSTIGKYLHVPVEHRTWTHTVWFMLPFIALGFGFWPFYLLAAGCAVHLLCDVPSKCGICWFYPISKYKKFGSGGAKIKKGHFWHLYSTTKGETVLCSVIWVMTTLLSVFALACWMPGFAAMLHIDAPVAWFSGFVRWLVGLFPGIA